MARPGNDRNVIGFFKNCTDFRPTLRLYLDFIRVYTSPAEIGAEERTGF
jgi:hypothetical protein